MGASELENIDRATEEGQIRGQRGIKDFPRIGEGQSGALEGLVNGCQTGLPITAMGCGNSQSVDTVEPDKLSNAAKLRVAADSTKNGEVAQRLRNSGPRLRAIAIGRVPQDRLVIEPLDTQAMQIIRREA